MPGEVFHPKVEECTDKIITAAKKHGKMVANVIYNPFNEEEISKRIKQGYQMLSVFADIALFRMAAYELNDRVREALEKYM